MRHSTTAFIALGTLGLLAACGNQDSAPVTEADLAAEVEQKRAELLELENDLANQQSGESAPADAGAAAPQVAASASAEPPRRPATTATSVTRPASSTRPASARPADPPAQAPVARTVSVPAGTEIPVSLVTPLSSKSTKVGEVVLARIASDVTVEGRTAIPQGLNVAGTVVKVISGSEKIGGTPTLVLAFDRIELPNGDDVAIAGEIESRGNSDNTRDAVKIVGGAAAGALIADQVSSKDRSKVIGGILGAAAGAVAARETGTEVKLAEGTPLTVVLSAPVVLPAT